MERPQGPFASAGSTASLSSLRGSSTLRIRIQDAQVKDTRLVSSAHGGSATNVRAPTSAPTLASPQRSMASVVDRRPRSGPTSSLTSLQDGSATERSDAHDDPAFDRRSAAESVSRNSRAASSAMVSTTSTALRAAAIATLERAIGRELPVQVRVAKMRRVPALDDEDEEADDLDRAEAGAEGDDAAPLEDGDGEGVPLPHVVLSAADVRAIKDADTLKFLHDNSLGFLRYVGETAAAAQGSKEASANPPVQERLSSSTGPRSSSRNALRASLGTEPRRTHGAEDIRALTQALCDDIATFITTVDGAGQEYVIATDKLTGQVIVPIDVDGGDGDDDDQANDVGHIDDLEGFDDEEDMTGQEADADLLGQPLPDLLTEQEGDDDKAAVASSFAEVLVKMRRDRLANARAEKREEEATEVQRRLTEIDAKLGITPAKSEGTRRPPPSEDPLLAIDEVEEDLEPAPARSSGKPVAGAKGVSFGTGWGHSVPTPPRADPSRATVAAVATVPEVKLFQPSTRPPPNRRIEAMLKFTSKDTRPNYMKATTTSNTAKGKQPPPAPTQAKPTPKPGYKSGFAKPAPLSVDASNDDDPMLQLEEGPRSESELFQDDGGASVQPEPRAAAAGSTNVAIRPARPQLTKRMEHRIDWLLEHDDYETAAPDADAAAGDDDALTVDAADHVHRLPISGAYRLPSRVNDIDALLENFAKGRGGAGLPTPQIDVAEDEELDPTAVETTRVLLAKLDKEEEAEQAGAAALPNGLTQSPKKAPPLKPSTETTQQAVTLAAEMALHQAQRAKALGTQYMREVKEQRETRKALSRVNERLAALSSEVESLHSAPFSMNRAYHLHHDPATWRWPGEEVQRPPDASRPASSAMQRTSDAVVKPPPQSMIDRLVEEARREQMRSKWTKP